MLKGGVVENSLLSERNFSTIKIIVYSPLDSIDDIISSNSQFGDKDSSTNRLAIHVFWFKFCSWWYDKLPFME